MKTSVTTTGASSQTGVFLGRQAVFNREHHVFGYELLFRSNADDNFCTSDNGDRKSCQTINNCLNVLGLRAITAGRKAFVNITRSLLLHEHYAVLPPSESVIELLETVKPDQAVVKACVRLKDAGYTLALDDFVFHPGYEPLLELADIVKVDFLATAPSRRASVVDVVAGNHGCLLAEKVETKDDHAEALELGYALFQGYFFCKPEILSGQELQPVKRNYLRFLQEAARPRPNFELLERIVKEDPSLSVKLLRFMNSAMFGLRSRVSSIKQALALLGEQLLRQWAFILAATSLGDDKPAELITLCLIRARFCEELCPLVGMKDRDMDLFLLGVLSMLEVLVDRPMSEVLAEIPVASDVKEALLGSTSLLGTVYGLVLACERSNVRLISLLTRKIDVPEERVMQVYCNAIQWADRILRASPETR